MNEICKLTIVELQRAIAQRELSAAEVCGAFLSRIEEKDPQIRAFLKVDRKGALRTAASIDDALAKGEPPGPLAGVPIAIKDVLVTRGLETTCGSRILEGYHPPYSATAVEKLQQAGAIVLGKTNCDEFAMGSSTENSAYFATRNPWSLDRVPGGSSGGSAACVAAREAPGSLGTDTGGSIRQPAAFCGVVGIKPTYGRVSRYGLVAFASSLDQIGPFARNVRDAACLLQALAGHDPADSTTSPKPVEDYPGALTGDLKGLRIGVVREWLESSLEPEIADAVGSAVNRLEQLGCSIDEVELPHSRYAIAAYYIVAPAEASSNLARYDGVRYGFRAKSAGDLAELYRKTRTQGFGSEVKRRIMLGTYALSSGYYDAYFLQAGRVRRLIKEDFDKAFSRVDLLVGPTTPSVAFRLGEKLRDPLQMYLSDVYTVTANLAGIPGLSLPCGLNQDGLPIGLQMLAPHFEETRLLQTAHALEAELDVTTAAEV